MKNSTPDLGRIGLSIKWNNICAQAWEFCIMKSKEWLENDKQASVLALANKKRGRTADVCWLCVHCVRCTKGKYDQTEFTYHMFQWIAGIKNPMLLILWLYL
jgi:hypothetical protein